MLSFIKNLFDEQVYAGEEAKLSSYNIQTAPVLQAALNLDPNPSKGGGDITVVDDSALLAVAGPSGTIADIENRPHADQISIYVVREGDSISQIATMFGVSINTIIWANDLKRGTLISPGQTLVILPITGVQHVVKSGDTLSSIAKKYKGDLDEIAHYNGVATDAKLTVGDTVFVPNGEIEAPAYSPKASGSALVRGSTGPSYSGYYIKPVSGARKSQGLHGYNAVDLAAPIGTPIVAAANGQVIVARFGGWNGGYGNYVVIRHPNGTQTLYSHLNSGIVYTGQSVIQGQVIGYVGQTGKATGPHLHFEVRGAQNPF